ncbi:NAD(+)/NADH kinase [Thermodesulfobacteriota bacterium]
MSHKAVGILYKHDFEPARVEAQKLEAWLKSKGLTVFSQEMTAEEGFDPSSKSSSSLPDSLDWVVVLGGDGTLLGAARKVCYSGIPILGVNLGGLGFLTGIPLQQLYHAVELMMKGGLEIESRLMIETKVIRSNKELFQISALNDVVINKGALARIIDLDVYVNDQFLTTYRSDGLIIATPTGSTAYNLSAGGPILYPTLDNFILTPICPFTLTNRPVIFPDSDRIVIKMGKASEEMVSLTFDGQVGFGFSHGDAVLIHKSEQKTKLVKSPYQRYFEILRAKLSWGGATLNKQ